MNKAPSPRYQSEKRTGTLRNVLPGGHPVFRDAWRWCTLCGNLWADWDEKSLHRCCCSPDYLAEFPDQEAVKSVHLIGGDKAVYEIEQELWVEHKRPFFDQRRLGVPR